MRQLKQKIGHFWYTLVWVQNFFPKCFLEYTNERFFSEEIVVLIYHSDSKKQEGRGVLAHESLTEPHVTIE